MKSYISYFKLKFITGLTYRASAWAGIATQFFFGFVYIMVYIAFYKSGGKELPMSLPQLVTYIWLGQAFFALINQFYKDNELFDLIKKGNISYELVRPQNIYFMWYFKILAQRLSKVIMRALPLIIVSLLLPEPYKLQLPQNITCFIMFIITLITGSLLVTALITLYPILTLITLNEKGIVNIVIVIADILSGLVVPIPFFPEILKKISYLLPFQYISDLPFRIYIGNISIINSIDGLIIQIVWLLILIALGYFILKKALKRVEVQGG